MAKKKTDHICMELNVPIMSVEKATLETGTEAKEISIVKLECGEEKAFQRIDDGLVLGRILYLGINDNPENYNIIDKPEDTDETPEVTEVQR